MSAHGPAQRPCGSCPYRRDVPSGVWAEEEYDKLPPFDLPSHEQPFTIFLCHQQTGRLCAGWCATHDMEESIGLRLACSSGRLTVADVEAARDYVCPVPLWGSGAEAAAHGKDEIYRPGPAADRVRANLRRKRVAE